MAENTENRNNGGERRNNNNNNRNNRRYNNRYRGKPGNKNNGQQPQSAGAEGQPQQKPPQGANQNKPVRNKNNRYRNNRYDSKKDPAEETVSDIRRDMSRIEKEIELEISEIRAMTLG